MCSKHHKAASKVLKM
uniref:Uncharacterized protein n=1 Tax=Arundo donax TaxID=35708 RepID=A0A0A8YPD3_ARUDO